MSYRPNRILAITLITFWSVVDGHSRSKEYRTSGEVVSSKNGGLAEPSCEELKAMWRFSKRQSRASEITNEIPMYRDPFANNVWEPYFTSVRSFGGQGRFNKYRNTPIYGRIVHNPPYFRAHLKSDKQKAFEEVARLYGIAPQEPRRKIATLRMAGDSPMHAPVSAMAFAPQQGSFQHLKELIKTERSRELQRQRAIEEVAARAAAMKDLAIESQRNRNGYYDPDHYDYSVDDGKNSGLRNYKSSNFISYPEILNVPSRHLGNVVRFVPDYSPSGSSRLLSERPIIYDSFNGGYLP